MRTGIANVPLHSGFCPRWLFEKMVLLGGAISEAIIFEYGEEEFLRRISDPFFFQSLGCVLGFDWHSSGLTTTVCAALKEGLRRRRGVGVFICGGKGKASRKTPFEIKELADGVGFDPDPLIYASRMSAKVDNSALQDGFQLYHHTFVFTKSGSWAVIQQGLKETTRMARRYHWLSDNLKDFVEEPHKAVCGTKTGETLNLVARESRQTREVSTQLVNEGIRTLMSDLKILNMPRSHSIKRTLYQVHYQAPKNFEELLGIKGVGPKTIRALALVSELIYGTRISWQDPVKYSFAHGGKDGFPRHLDYSTYNYSIDVLEKAVSKAKIGRREKLNALKRLPRFF